jgi:hypothetical protein
MSTRPQPQIDRVSHFVSTSRQAARESFLWLLERVISDPVIYKCPTQFFLLPLLLSSECWAGVTAQAGRLLRLVERLVFDLLQDARSATHVLGLEDEDLELARACPPAHSTCLARPDFVLGSQQGCALFLELNVDSSLGGLGTADALNELYDAMPILQELRQKVPLRYEPLMPRISALLQRHAGKNRPLAAIVDWRDEIDEAPWPYERMVDSLGRHGVEAVIAGEDDLDFDGRRLYAGGRAVDVVFRGITPGEKTRRQSRRFTPLLEACRGGKVPLLSDWWAPFFSSKRAIALLSELASNGSLPTEDRLFVQRHVPWSRRLGECFTVFQDGRTDLIPLLRARREEFVIKSPSDGSAKNVTIGREVTASDWLAAIDAGLSHGGYIVQQYVEHPVTIQPVLTEDGFDLTGFRWNLATFLIDGCAAGSCFRGLPAASHYRVSCRLGAREGTVFLAGWGE